MSELQRPRVSVVMPVYNSMPYLTGTVQSLLDQDLGDGELEIIAVDDGSTDGSGEELDRFAETDPRLTVIHQPNSGWPGMPRNRGLEQARGEYVFFMDSDDTMTPDALRIMADMADRDEADVVVPRMQGAGGRAVQGLFAKHPDGAITIERAMETISPQKLFRRSMVEEHQIRFPEGKVRLEDGMFVSRAYVLARRIDFAAPKPLYFIAARDDGQNISSRGIDPEGYVNSVRTIAGILTDGVEDPARAERLVLELFQRKGLRFYAPKRWLKMKRPRKEAWVRLHQQFLQDLVRPELDATASKPLDAEKIAIIREGDVDKMDRLIGVSGELNHTSRAVSAEFKGDFLVLTVVTDPSFESDAGARQSLAAAVNRLASPLQGIRLVRGGARRVENALLGTASHVSLQLAGRSNNAISVIPGRAATFSQQGAGTGAAHNVPAHRFLVPLATLARYGRDVIDAWTVASDAEGLQGERARVTVKHGLKLPKKEGVRVYATIQDNLSIDRRKVTSGS